EILLGLRGEAEHEIELEAPPSEAEDQFGCLYELLFAVLLLNDVTEPLGPCFRRERESGFADALDLGQDVRIQRIDPRRRQRDRDPGRCQAVHQLREQGVDAAVVAGAEREQGDLVVAALLEELLGVSEERLRIALAERTIDVARLTEATSLHA